jgi:hypothetical protein
VPEVVGTEGTIYLTAPCGVCGAGGDDNESSRVIRYETCDMGVVDFSGVIHVIVQGSGRARRG